MDYVLLHRVGPTKPSFHKAPDQAPDPQAGNVSRQGGSFIHQLGKCGACRTCGIKCTWSGMSVRCSGPSPPSSPPSLELRPLLLAILPMLATCFVAPGCWGKGWHLWGDGTLWWGALDCGDQAGTRELGLQGSVDHSLRGWGYAALVRIGLDNPQHEGLGMP